MRTKVTIRFSSRFLCSLSIAASASISASLVEPCFNDDKGGVGGICTTISPLVGWLTLAPSGLLRQFSSDCTPPSSWRSPPPARGSCAPTPFAVPHRSQRPPGDWWWSWRQWWRCCCCHLHWTFWNEVAEMALRKLLAVRRDQRVLIFPAGSKTFSLRITILFGNEKVFLIVYKISHKRSNVNYCKNTERCTQCLN